MNITKLFLFSSNLTKTKDLLNKISQLCWNRMDTVINEFKRHWNESVQKGTLEKNPARIHQFQRVKLELNSYHQMIDYLKEKFYQSEHNIFELHLYLVEKCLDNNKDMNRTTTALLVSHAFSDWKNQMTNVSKRKNTEHLTPQCKENVCNCKTDELIIRQAFNLALTRNLSLLTSFNKIYNFTNYSNLLEPLAKDHISKLNYTDQATLIGELNLQDKVDLKNIVVPLMILDKFTLIDDIIKKDQRTLLCVMEICDKLCENDLNLKEFASNYSELRNKKLDKFRAKNIARYASNCLKRNKKLHLISNKYSNIAFQLKLSQMRFLCNSRYDKMSVDPISFDAWSELLLDLIGNDEALQMKLLLELIQYQKDVEVAHKFLTIFGYEKLFTRLSESHREFIRQNLKFINSEQKTDLILNSDKYYYPNDLKDKIKFVQTHDEFKFMLDYFESQKPLVIGLDCEWKPSFDLMDKEEENKNRSSTFQIATNDHAFILDMKDLIDSLDDSQLDLFGRLVLFNEDLIKLGYSFQQDAKKLSNSFPKFRHKFSEFEDSVINLDEIVNEIQKKCKLFNDTDDVTSKQSKSTSKQPRGLSELTRKCFGKQLNKTECISNWDARPLREAQLRYAALDAYVLLQIHEFIQNRIKTLGLNIDYTSKKLYF